MEERIEFGLKAVQTLNFRALCQECGISAKAGYKWKERYLREGIAGMAGRVALVQEQPAVSSTCWSERDLLRRRLGVRSRRFLCETHRKKVTVTQPNGEAGLSKEKG
jgi:transposase